MANGNGTYSKGPNLNTAIALAQLMVILAGIVVGIKYAEFRADNTDKQIQEFRYEQRRMSDALEELKRDVAVIKAQPSRRVGK